MKKKTVFIGGISMLLVAGFLFAGCVSLRPQMITIYTMSMMPDAGTLRGKSAVVLDMAMAEKILPKRAKAKNIGGGLVGLALGAAAGVADSRTFINEAGSDWWIEQENAAIAGKQPALFSSVASRYSGSFNASAARAAFYFGGVTPEYNFFSEADSYIRSSIAVICEEKDVDYAITMIGQIRYAEAIDLAPISAQTILVVQVCLFDRNGTLVSVGDMQTVEGTTYRGSHVSTLNMLLDDAIENIALMIPSLGGDGEVTGKKQYVPNTGR